MWIVFEQKLTRDGPKWAFVACEKDSRTAKRRAAANNNECKRLGWAPRYWYCSENVYTERVNRGVAEAVRQPA